MRRHGLLLLVLGSLLGCGKIEGEHGQPGAEAFVVGTPGGVPAFVAGDARLTVAHSGIRRLEFSPVSGSGIAYRERIVTDGHGRYAITPDSLIGSSTLDWELFDMLQRSREGFAFRYRDLSVQDERLFLRNWRTTDLGPSGPIAGRACGRYQLERAVGAPVRYVLDVDTGTNLILATERYDAAGQLLATMIYESLELDPALDGVVWHRPSNAERPADPDELGARPLRPRLLPDGYGSESVALVSEDSGNDWLKLTYTDGLQTLFLLQELRPRTPGRVRQTRSNSDGFRFGIENTLLAFQVGAATVLQGQVEGFELMVIGLASEAELLDMVESALP